MLDIALMFLAGLLISAGVMTLLWLASVDPPHRPTPTGETITTEWIVLDKKEDA